MFATWTWSKATAVVIHTSTSLYSLKVCMDQTSAWCTACRHFFHLGMLGHHWHPSNPFHFPSWMPLPSPLPHQPTHITKATHKFCCGCKLHHVILATSPPPHCYNSLPRTHKQGINNDNSWCWQSAIGVWCIIVHRIKHKLIAPDRLYAYMCACGLALVLGLELIKYCKCEAPVYVRHLPYHRLPAQSMSQSKETRHYAICINYGCNEYDIFRTIKTWVARKH